MPMYMKASSWTIFCAGWIEPQALLEDKALPIHLLPTAAHASTSTAFHPAAKAMSRAASSCSAGARRALGADDDVWAEIREALGALADNYCPVGQSDSDDGEDYE